MKESDALSLSGPSFPAGRTLELCDEVIYVSVPSAGLNLRNKWRATKVDSVEFWCGCRCQVFATGSCGCVGGEELSGCEVIQGGQNLGCEG